MAGEYYSHEQGHRYNAAIEDVLEDGRSVLQGADLERHRGEAQRGHQHKMQHGPPAHMRLQHKGTSSLCTGAHVLEAMARVM